MLAAQKKLDNLIAFTDYNRAQIDGTTMDINDLDPLDKKWESFRWNVINVTDGNDCLQIEAAIEKAKQFKNGKPTMIILNTVKGKGVSFVESEGFANHSMKISKEQMEAAIEEIRRS